MKTGLRWARVATTSAYSAAFPAPLFATNTFEKNPDCSAAGKPGLEGGFVGDAKCQYLWLAGFQDLGCLGNDGTFNAATRNRSFKILLIIDCKPASDRLRR